MVEQFQPIGDIDGRRDTAVLEAGFTLVRHHRGPDELYRRDPLSPVEGPDLLAGGGLPADARDALQRLRRQLRADP